MTKERLTRAELRRFMRAFDVQASGCWVWRRSTNGRYGKLKVRDHFVYAHRVMFATWYGFAAGTMKVLHRCDNPLCVNPAHLFLGTQADNVDDMWSKGRGVKPPRHIGDAHPRAKLTAEDVAFARARHIEGESVASLARAFRVGETTMHHAIHRGTWRHVQ